MGTNAAKHARQSEHRNRLDQARRQVEAEARRRRTFTIVGVLLALAVVIVAIVVMTDSGEDDAAPAAECPPADGAAERVQTFDGPPPMCIDPAASYSATLHTTHGDITIALDAVNTPITANNFVVLSRFRYFDDVPFHRIVPGFVIQAGDGDGPPWGSNDLGYTIEDELPADSSAYTDYSVAMANAGPNSGASQFFIVLPGGGAQLGPSYSRFGEVTAGRDVVDHIGTLGEGESPTEDVTIERVTITES